MAKTNEEMDMEIFGFFTEVSIIAQLSISLFERQLPEGLTNSQFGVLNWFHRVDNEATPGRLAAAFQVTPGAMTNTLKRLEAKALIKVEPDASSGRRKRVTITPEGRDMRQRAIESATPLLAELVQAFSPSAIAEQTRELAKIREYLDAYRYRES
jgi:DNA-binding MarR family transcriptional regulator